jgi:PAS domain S-box-containing protein
MSRLARVPLRLALLSVGFVVLILYLAGDYAPFFPSPIPAWSHAAPWIEFILIGISGAGIYVVLRRVQEADLATSQLRATLETTESSAREAAQVTLARERDVLYRIMENTGAQLAFLDPEFRFMHANAAYVTASGHALESLLGKNHFDLFPDPENQAIFERVRATRQAVTFRAKPFEFTDQPWRGTTYWDWSLVPVPDSTGGLQGLVFSLIDVTETTRAVKEREALLEEVDSQRSILQTIIDHVPAGIVFLDRTTFRVVWANQAYNQFLEPPFRTEGIVDRVLDEFIPRAAETGVRSVFQRVAETGEPYHNWEFAYDGFARGTTYWQWSLVPVKAVDELDGLLLLVNEVTELVEARKQVEVLVKETRRRADELASLLEVSQDLVSTLDLEQILLRILAHLRPILDFNKGAVFVPQQGQLAILVYDADAPDDALQWVHTPLEGAPLFREVAKRRVPVMVDDLTDETDPLARMLQHETSEAVRGTFEGSRSWLGIPLLFKGRVVGMLRVTHSEPAHFTLRQAEVALGIANQAAVAVENAQLYRQAQLAAALEERQRLARELHDSISQALYGIALGSHAALEMLSKKPGEVESALRYILTLAESAVTEMRALIFELRPESLEREGLIGALERQAAAIQARYRVQVRATLGEEPDLPLAHKEALYRIAQEAMQNAGRHANARGIDLRLCAEPGAVVLQVEDDGKGFDPDLPYPAHLGLQSMRERAANVGLNLTIHSASGRGTIIRVTIPHPLPPLPKGNGKP